MFHPKHNTTSKRGLAWESQAVASDFSSFNDNSSILSWAYNWSPEPGVLAESSLEFVPMQWNHVNIEMLSTRLSDIKSNTVLGFNEPDYSEGPFMPPSLEA
ncbi:hypothetical protein Clacol_004791 [Clathrus columnatus]|uniref:Asl1-like glycosyl hydrolase catalytic domain-containing protein n=1 Tax=Clathrus columnatus TaxID=1419009 RepID=A0AAV5ABH4_9AGAM|nr:hypothetical protein Clacol_004791 [Clathrus columnatus]